MVTNQEGMRMIGAYPADEKRSIFKLVYLTPDAQLLEILYQPSDGTFGEWKPITPPALTPTDKTFSLPFDRPEIPGPKKLKFTRVELERLAKEGLTGKEIAQRLNSTKGTVYFYLSKFKIKLVPYSGYKPPPVKAFKDMSPDEQKKLRELYK